MADSAESRSVGPVAAERDGPDSPAAVDLGDPHGRLSPGSRVWLEERIGRALTVLAVPGQLSVRVMEDPEMAEAHQRHTGVGGTTDVLTFDLAEDFPNPSPGGPRRLEADLLVCVDEAQRQAAARGHEPERELLLYVIHGVLHCLGYDDHDEAAAARMHAEEDRILGAIGVGATFAREASP